MSKLKTETDTAEMQDRVLEAAQAILDPPHETIEHAFFEHGQWWVMCACGATWSAVDATGGRSADGFDFEQVSEGDGLTCQ